MSSSFPHVVVETLHHEPRAIYGPFPSEEAATQFSEEAKSLASRDGRRYHVEKLWDPATLSLT